MKERFPSAPSGPEQEKRGPEQEDIDLLYRKLKNYEPSGRELARIARALLAQEGMDVTEEAIAAGGSDVDGTPRDISIELDSPGPAGLISCDVSVRDRFIRVSGTTLNFRKRFQVRASPEAIERWQAEQDEKDRAYEAESAERKRKLSEALKIFRPYAAAHLGETLGKAEWEAGAHGLRGVFFKEGLPDGASWIITEEEGDRLRITIKDAGGSVYDVYEFGPED